MSEALSLAISSSGLGLKSIHMNCEQLFGKVPLLTRIFQLEIGPNEELLHVSVGPCKTSVLLRKAQSKIKSVIWS